SAGIVFGGDRGFPLLAFLRILAIFALLPLNVPAFGAAQGNPFAHTEPSQPAEVPVKRTCKCGHIQCSKPTPRETIPTPKQKPPHPAKPCCPDCCAICSTTAILATAHGVALTSEDAPPALVVSSFTSIPHAGFRSLLDRPPRV